MKKKILALIVSLCLIFGGGMLATSNSNLKQADAANPVPYIHLTSTAASSSSALGYVGGGAPLAYSSVANGKFVIRFDILDVQSCTSNASAYWHIAFSLDTGFGSRTSGNNVNFANHTGGTMLDFSNSGSSASGATTYYGDSATPVNGVWINTIGMDDTQVNFYTDPSYGWPHVTIWMEADIAAGTLQTYYGLYWDGVQHAKNLGVRVEGLFKGCTSADTYYPTLWLGDGGDTGNYIDLGNLTFYQDTNADGTADTTYASTSFTGADDICYAWPFSHMICLNGVLSYEYLTTGESMSFTDKGATIRADKTGLRFTTQFDLNHYNTLVSTYGASKIELGFVVASSKLIASTGTLKAETASALIVPATNKYNNVYSVVITDIPSNKLSTLIYARPYMKVVDSTTYYVYGNQVSANIGATATAAYQDRSASKTGEYIYQTAEGDYSKFTQDQLTTIFNNAPELLADKYDSYWMPQHDYQTMPIVGYIAPPIDTANKLGTSGGYTTNFVGTQAKANTEYATVAASGINTVVAVAQSAIVGAADYDAINEVRYSLNAAAANGISYIASSPSWFMSCGTDITWQLGSTFYVNELKNYEAFGGYAMCDEPGRGSFEQIKRTQDTLIELCGGSMAALAWHNLFPSYANNDQICNNLLPWTGASASYTYAQYVADFASIVQPQFISLDNYPVKNTGLSGSTGFLANTSQVRKAAAGNGVPFWNFINTCIFGTNAVSSQAHISWPVNMSLAFGAKGIEYFTYYRPADSTSGSFSGAMIDTSGNKTTIYNYVTNANNIIKSVDQVLMCCNYIGVVQVGNSFEAIPTSDAIGAYGILDAAEVYGDHSVIGCFDYNGQQAYYVVNNSIDSTDMVDIYWAANGGSGYKIQNGTKTTWSGTEISLSLSAGEGVLIVVEKML